MRNHHATSAKVPWKPRASSIGSYMKCLWRAAQDRLLHEGNLPPGLHTPQLDTSHADFGTCCHFLLQDGTRCTFPGDPKDFAPSEEQWVSAASLYGGNREVTYDKAKACAELGARRLPATPTKEPWLSEHFFENEFVSGHLDFLSPCRTVMGDLKTTKRTLTNRRAKTEAQAQMAAYYLLTGAARGFVLYVDSSNAAWSTNVPVNFTTDAMKFYADQVAGFCQFLMTDRLFDVAFPNLDHQNCHGSWCPYRASCYDKYAFQPGQEFNALAARMPTGSIRDSFRK